MKVAVSFLKSNYDVDTTIEKINESIADYIHVDMMDGIFVENKNLELPEVKRIAKIATKPLDVHLMACSPNKYVREIAKIKGVEYMTIHYESHRRPIDVINMIRHTPMKVGLAINPETNVTKIIPLLNHLDQVLVMSVKPGKGGQAFREEVLHKIAQLKDIRDQNNYHYIISVDGGINDRTAKLCKRVGADMLVSGSYVCTSDDYNEKIKSLQK